MTLRALALAALAFASPLGAASQYVQEPQLEACRLWNEATHALISHCMAARAAGHLAAPPALLRSFGLASMGHSAEEGFHFRKGVWQGLSPPLLG